MVFVGPKRGGARGGHDVSLRIAMNEVSALDSATIDWEHDQGAIVVEEPVAAVATAVVVVGATAFVGMDNF